VLALGPRLSGPWFDAAERERVAAYALQASALVENAALHDRLVERAGLERDVQLARRIQERLLPPSAPVLPTVDLAGATQPAGEIGGDYYDFLPLGPRTIGLVVADVCGKGLPAALLLAGVQAGLRSRVVEDQAPGAALARINEELVLLRQPEKFVCLAYARLDARRRTITWANAGLNPPIVVHADGRWEEVEHGGLILGVSAGEAYEELAWTFERGSLVAFYTDGLTDARRGDETFGPEELGPVLARDRGLRAERIAARALAAAAGWHRDGPPDDRTIIIVKFM
jgi:sigma-B regulation protein RsbU (phosphoserine phosphatase)